MGEIALPTKDKKTVEKKESTWVAPEFKISGVFSDNMVVQRDRIINIFGFSNKENTVVYGSLDGKRSRGEVKDGKWMLSFEPRPASNTPFDIKIWDDFGHKEQIRNVLCGDVWVIGGQSNGEVLVSLCLHPGTEFDENDNFRLFMQRQIYVYEHQDCCDNPQPDTVDPNWRWQKPDEGASMAFSALGYYFAKALTQKIDIPVGIINMSAGGACLRELCPEELAHELGYHYGALVKEGGLYNALIHPFIGISFKGMIFFQGESEAGMRELAEKYDFDLKEFIKDERKRFGFDFPFYMVQISDYREEGKTYFPFLPMLRIKQFDAAKEIKNCALIASYDLGSPDGYEDFAHSPRKKEVSDRIAALALAKEYKKGGVKKASSPVPCKCSLMQNGRQVRVAFKNVSGRLCSKNGTRTVAGFSFGKYDENVPAHAEILDRDTIVIDIPDKADISILNYALINHITDENVQLCDKTGLVVPAFSIKVETDIQL